MKHNTLHISLADELDQAAVANMYMINKKIKFENKKLVILQAGTDLAQVQE